MTSNEIKALLGTMGGKLGELAPKAHTLVVDFQDTDGQDYTQELTVLRFPEMTIHKMAEEVLECMTAGGRAVTGIHEVMGKTLAVYYLNPLK